MDTALGPLCTWLAATQLSLAIQTHEWVIPTLQSIHILGIAVVFSSALFVNLGILRLVDRSTPLAETGRRFLPSIWITVPVLALTGALLIIGEPERSLQNTTFLVKMGLLILALLLTGAIQASIASPSGNPGGTGARLLATRVAALVSMLVWCGVIFAGRWIAYTQVSG